MDIAVGIQLGITAQLGFHPGSQLQRIKWLYYIVICPCSQSQNLIQIRRLGTQHNNGNIVGFPDLLAHLQTIHPRHHNVQKDQMNVLLIQNYQPVLGVGRLKYFISIADQIDLHQIRDLLLIINYQNISLCHIGFLLV